MDIAKVRALSDDEIVEELAKARRHLYDLRFQLATRQLNDFSQISQTRRDIARLLTVQTERQLEGRAPVAAAAGAQPAGAATTSTGGQP
jgi:large subunit ribosomal protein L29